MKVLIVDDHILFRQGLVGLLQKEPDFEIVGEAGTLKEAIQQARLHNPEMILMDFSLPDGTGADATQVILAQNPDCKIIFLSVHAADEKLFSAVRSGAVGYLLKSLPINKLLTVLRSVKEGEAAISRTMMRSILNEFSRPGGAVIGHSDVFDCLTHRERDVLRELMIGASNREIADKLTISENTVKHHIHSLLAKLELNDRRDAARMAKEHGLV